MTSLESLFRATVEAVDGACPCTHFLQEENAEAIHGQERWRGAVNAMIGVGVCTVECACLGDGHTRKCAWPGHATIRERLRKITEQQHSDPLVLCCECELDYTDPHCAALRERLKEAINGR